MIYSALDVAVAPMVLIPLGIILGALLLVAAAIFGIVLLLRPKKANTPAAGAAEAAEVADNAADSAADAGNAGETTNDTENKQ